MLYKIIKNLTKEKYTIKEIAGFCHKSHDYVLKHIKKGNLEGVKIKNCYIIKREDVINFLEKINNKNKEQKGQISCVISYIGTVDKVYILAKSIENTVREKLLSHSDIIIEECSLLLNKTENLKVRIRK